MRRIVLLTIVLVFLLSSAAFGQWTLWGLTEQNYGLDDYSITGRAGKQFEQVEVFIGSSWWPSYDGDEMELKPPQVFSVGGLYHYDDLIDPNNPLPIIPDFLLTFLRPEFVATPYFGMDATFNIDKDAGYISSIAGLQLKSNAESKVALITEVGYKDTFAQLSALPEKFRFNVGLRYEF